MRYQGKEHLLFYEKIRVWSCALPSRNPVVGIWSYDGHFMTMRWTRFTHGKHDRMEIWGKKEASVFANIKLLKRLRPLKIKHLFTYDSELGGTFFF